MGCGASISAVVGGETPQQRRDSENDYINLPHVPSLTVRKRKSIFESTDEYSDEKHLSMNLSYLDDSTRIFLMKSLADYFGIDSSSAEYVKLGLFVYSMRREEISGGVTILMEGQYSSKLYVVDFGYVQITVRSNFVKTVGKGAVLGEMALKGENDPLPAPQTPLKSTAHCITKAVLWSLDKDDIQKIEFTASSEMLLRGALFEYFGGQLDFTLFTCIL